MIILGVLFFLAIGALLIHEGIQAKSYLCRLHNEGNAFIFVGVIFVGIALALAILNIKLKLL